MNNTQAIKRIALFGPTDYATAVASATAALIGADAAVVTIGIGLQKNTNAAATSPTVQILHSDDTSSFSTNDAVKATTTYVSNTNSVRRIHFAFSTKALKKYVKVTVTPDTTTNGNLSMQADLELFRLENVPASVSSLVGSTHDSFNIV